MSCGRCGVHNCVDSEDAFSFGCFSRLSYLRQITKQNKPLAVRVRAGACAGIINLELTECCVSPARPEQHRAWTKGHKGYLCPFAWTGVGSAVGHSIRGGSCPRCSGRGKTTVVNTRNHSGLQFRCGSKIMRTAPGNSPQPPAITLSPSCCFSDRDGRLRQVAQRARRDQHLPAFPQPSVLA